MIHGMGVPKAGLDSLGPPRPGAVTVLSHKYCRRKFHMIKSAAILS